MWKKTGSALRTEIAQKQRKESGEPPADIRKQCNVISREFSGHSCYIMTPAGDSGNASSNKEILYLHGGGYVLKISPLHWSFLAGLVDKLRCTITVPMYPLAPEYNHTDVFGMLVPLYEELLSGMDGRKQVVMGDSAGGGMALALAQLLKERGIPAPAHTILISPALDMTFSNPEIGAVQRKDPVTAVPAVREIAQWYAGAQPVTHPLISPLYGRLDGLGPLSIFTGTHDIVYPDVKRLKHRMLEQGIPAGYYEYPRMLHIWPLFFFPESERAREQIYNIINGL
ncbi:alpha/beta hydrolase [Paenibacillus sp. MMS20-IR301]|uniref:alpha/beta hydrolase n=1 Tax=Paenibacillus sp. MMS20-IR301 TaxID=2895946 RepID=UPI0028E2F06A|nr:alpha/beta hydrolase [Paenibacillus sp. MMS20-IR301]WNS45474.1 alpha/beta hydrolase [Paenibacillus sp. MMS20-IR301]